MDNQSTRPSHSEAASLSRERSRIRTEGADFVDNNGSDTVEEDQLWRDATAGDPNTPLGPSIDDDLRTSEDLAVNDGPTEVGADADAAADWDMIGAPSDEAQALLPPFGLPAPEDQVYGAFGESGAAGTRIVEKRRIMGKAWELMVEFRRIIRA